MKYWIAIFFSATVVSAMAACPVDPANTPSEAAKRLAISKLGALLKCDPKDPLNDRSPCNTFASKGLESSRPNRSSTACPERSRSFCASNECAAAGPKPPKLRLG